MKVETWCSQHAITKANYYYRLKRVCKACLVVCDPEPSFLELPQPAETKTPTETGNFKPAVTLRSFNGIKVEIYNYASAEIIRIIMGELNHVV